MAALGKEYVAAQLSDVCHLLGPERLDGGGSSLGAFDVGHEALLVPWGLLGGLLLEALELTG